VSSDTSHPKRSSLLDESCTTTMFSGTLPQSHEKQVFDWYCLFYLLALCSYGCDQDALAHQMFSHIGLYNSRSHIQRIITTYTILRVNAIQNKNAAQHTGCNGKVHKAEKFKKTSFSNIKAEDFTKKVKFNHRQSSYGKKYRAQSHRQQVCTSNTSRHQ